MSIREFKKVPKGTEATKVIMYNRNGEVVNMEYVLYANPEHSKEVEELKSIDYNYWTETYEVIKT